MRYGVAKMVSGKNTVFWCVMCSVVSINDVSEDPAVPNYTGRFTIMS